MVHSACVTPQYADDGSQSTRPLQIDQRLDFMAVAGLYQMAEVTARS